MHVLDLFCGIGGLSLGFGLGLCDSRVYGLDVDRFAVDTYNYNLNGLGHRADVADLLKTAVKGDYDLVIGGPPCQPFSIANRAREGADHPLFPTLSRFYDIVLELRPKVFVMENVKGLVSRKHREVFEAQLRRVSGDYVVTWGVVNMAYYGVPQKRVRVFVVGVRRDLGVKPSLPAPTHSETERKTLTGKLFRWVTTYEAIGDLLGIAPNSVLTAKRSVTEGVVSKVHKPFFRADEPSFTVPSTSVLKVLDHDPKVYTMNFSDKSLVKHKPYKPWMLDSPSSTIRSNFGNTPPDSTIALGGRKYRKLSVREVMRLQTFPDWFTFPANVSNSRKYRLVGNAVPPVFAYRLAVHLGKLMGWKTCEPPDRDLFDIPFFTRAFADYFKGVA